MTPEGEKWVDNIADTQEFVDWHDMASPLSRRAAEFWITSIFAEIDRGATLMAIEVGESEPQGIEYYATLKRIKSWFGL